MNNLLKTISVFLLLIMISSCTQNDQVSEDLDQGGLIEKRHRVYDEPAITDACELTISIGSCFKNNPQFMQAFSQAIDMYNDIPHTGINMTFINENAEEDADIHFDCLVGFPCFGGEGMLGGTAEEFYDGDDETNTIYLNTDMPEIEECCGEDFNTCNITGLIVHEIGHALGLAHTNSLEGNHIEGTPTNDANSIFNGESFCETGCNFTGWDILALQLIHPACNCGEPPAFEFDYDGPTCLNEVETIGISPTWTPQDLTVTEWTSSSNLSVISKDGSYIRFQALSAGPARVCATVENQCGLSTTECFFFTVSPEVNCEDTGEPGGFGLGPR